MPWAVRWLRHGGDLRWALHPETWLVLRRELDSFPQPPRLLELGAGLGGILAAARGASVTAVDDRSHDLDRVREAARELPIELVLAPLRSTSRGLGYSFGTVPSRDYELIFVDGPSVGREGLLTEDGLTLLERATVIVVDDAVRPEEHALAADVAARLGRSVVYEGPAAVIRRRDEAARRPRPPTPRA